MLGRGGGEWRHGVSSGSCLSLSRDPGILHDEYRHYRETDDQISTSNLKKNILRVLGRAPAGGTRTAYRRPFLPAAPAAEGRHMAGPAPLQLATAPRAVVSTACTLDCPRLALCRTGRLLAPTPHYHSAVNRSQEVVITGAHSSLLPSGKAGERRYCMYYAGWIKYGPF